MAKDTNEKATAAAPRQLPSGWLVEEATGEKGEWTVKSVWGTRLYAKTRFWLLEFEGYPRLQWVPEEFCGCKGKIGDFKAYMGWAEPPKESNVELIHPDLMKAKKEATTKPKAEASGSATAAAPSTVQQKTVVKKDAEPSTSGGLKRAAAAKQPTNNKQVKKEAAIKPKAGTSGSAAAAAPSSVQKKTAFKKKNDATPAKPLRVLRSASASVVKTK